MPDASDQTLQIEALIDRLNVGDEEARKELLGCACQRLMRLTRKMLKGFPRVHRWEQTDDVFQNASLRLYRTLAQVTPPGARDFFRLAALSIRRELLDLAKHYYGPEGLGMNHASLAGDGDSGADPLADRAGGDSGGEADQLAAWTEFHSQIDRLPDEERELFDLLWYQECTQAEAAVLLKVSESTIKRRWASARLKLHQMLKGTLPEV